MAIGTLYIEQLRATRGHFAWLGVVILFAVGCVATAGTQELLLMSMGRQIC